MSTIRIYVGPPATGKTTAALEWAMAGRRVFMDECDSDENLERALALAEGGYDVAMTLLRFNEDEQSFPGHNLEVVRCTRSGDQFEQSHNTDLQKMKASIHLGYDADPAYMGAPPANIGALAAWLIGEGWSKA